MAHFRPWLESFKGAEGKNAETKSANTCQTLLPDLNLCDQAWSSMQEKGHCRHGSKASQLQLSSRQYHTQPSKHWFLCSCLPLPMRAGFAVLSQTAILGDACSVLQDTTTTLT